MNGAGAGIDGETLPSTMPVLAQQAPPTPMSTYYQEAVNSPLPARADAGEGVQQQEVLVTSGVDAGAARWEDAGIDEEAYEEEEEGEEEYDYGDEHAYDDGIEYGLDEGERRIRALEAALQEATENQDLAHQDLMGLMGGSE